MSVPDLTKLRIDRNKTAPARSRFGARGLTWMLVVIAAAGVAFYWRSTLPLQVETTTVTTAHPSQGYTLLNATGYVVAQRKAAVASKATGRLEWLGVREGSTVRANEVLARLENRDVTAHMEQAAANVKLAQANVEQAQAEVREAERAFNRSRELLAKSFVSSAAHDAALGRFERANASLRAQQAAVAVAQANLRASQVAVDQTLIRAPFDGIVLTKNANVGDVITPLSSAVGSQAAVVTMADMSTLEVEADVSESAVGKVSVGQHCEIQLDALPESRFRGMVSRMVPTVDRAKATVTVKVRFEDKDERILPEMSAKVAFLSQQIPPDQRGRRTVVAPDAVVERSGKRIVFVVQNDRAVATAVQTGAKLGEFVEVTEGVEAGAKVVVRPPETLQDGMAVSLQSGKR